MAFLAKYLAARHARQARYAGVGLEVASHTSGATFLQA